jgi:valyl-tRNA synthetase
MSKSKGNTLDPLDLIDGITLPELLAKSTVGLLRADHKARIEKYVRAHYPQGIAPPPELSGISTPQSRARLRTASAKVRFSTFMRKEKTSPPSWQPKQ